MSQDRQDNDFAIPNLPADKPTNSGELFGHPKGLYVLFFTEMWERFSFYGMRALLILYMLNHFFWTQEDASALMGWYAFLAYALPVFGGLIADKWLGARRTVVLGALILSAGHLLMAFEPKPFFFTALGLIVVGVGLLKPNISTQVGALYKPGDHRRDGAFTIFYMGINIGAFLGPIVCDWLRVHYGYHYGFAAAGVGMMFGLFVYVMGQRKLKEFNQDVVAGGGVAVPATPPHIVRARVIVLLVIFAFVILFWMAFEQSSNAMVVWADQFTNLQLFSSEAAPVVLDGVATGEAATGLAALEITAGATQSINPLFIIILASPLAFLWTKMDKRGIQPSTPAKMVLGIAGVSGAFVVMVPAASFENRPSNVALAALPDRVDLSQYGATRLTYDEQNDKLHMQGVLPENDRLRMLADTAPMEFTVAVAAVERAFTKDEYLHFALPSAAASLENVGDESGKAYKWDDATNTLSVSSQFDERARDALLASVQDRKFKAELAVALDAVDDVNAVLTESGEVTAVLASAPPAFRISGDEAEEVFTWDDTTKTLTVSNEINERARMQLLAMAGDPAFKSAVDDLYVKTSMFRISIWWLMLHYLLATMGELCLSPVGLSLVTKLAPPKHVGLFMGGWFLATAIAEKLAHVFGSMWGNMTPTKYFMIFVVICGVGALMLATLVPALKRMMHEET